MKKVSSSNGLEKYPKLRFPEFTDPWLKSTVGSCFNFQNGKAHENNVVENGEFIIVNSKFISSDGTIKKYSNNLICPLKKDDIVMVMSDVPNGKAMSKCFLIPENDKFTLNQRICSLSGSKTPLFHLYQISRNRFYLKFDDGVSQTNLKKEDVLNCPIYNTDFNEQNKISSFLALIDKRIEKQQQLVELLKKYKKGLSNEFFEKIHADNRNEKIKFSDAYEILQNNTFSRELLTTNPSKVSNIHYGDILTKYNSILDIQATLVPFIKENVDVSKFLNSSYLREGDIIFADTAEDYTVGKAIEITKVKGEKILSGLHTIPCRPKRNIVIGYMGHYFNSKEYRLQILPLIQGTKVSSISKSELMKTQIVLPPTEEQRLITNCLSLYDSKIFIEEKTIEELKKLKVSLLQQLFI